MDDAWFRWETVMREERPLHVEEVWRRKWVWVVSKIPNSISRSGTTATLSNSLSMVPWDAFPRKSPKWIDVFVILDSLMCRWRTGRVSDSEHQNHLNHSTTEQDTHQNTLHEYETQIHVEVCKEILWLWSDEFWRHYFQWLWKRTPSTKLHRTSQTSRIPMKLLQIIHLMNTKSLLALLFQDFLLLSVVIRGCFSIVKGRSALERGKSKHKGREKGRAWNIGGHRLYPQVLTFHSLEIHIASTSRKKL